VHELADTARGDREAIARGERFLRHKLDARPVLEVSVHGSGFTLACFVLDLIL
jgi:hypothetical protein